MKAHHPDDYILKKRGGRSRTSGSRGYCKCYLCMFVIMVELLPGGEGTSTRRKAPDEIVRSAPVVRNQCQFSCNFS